MRLPEITSQEDLHLRLVPIADVPERNKNTFTGVISRQKNACYGAVGHPAKFQANYQMVAVIVCCEVFVPSFCFSYQMWRRLVPLK